MRCATAVLLLGWIAGVLGDYGQAEAGCRRPLFRGRIFGRACRQSCCDRPACTHAAAASQFRKVRAAYLAAKRCVVAKLVTTGGITAYLVQECPAGATTVYFNHADNLPGGGCSAPGAFCYELAEDLTAMVTQPKVGDLDPAPVPDVTKSNPAKFKFSLPSSSSDIRTVQTYTFSVGGIGHRGGYEVADDPSATLIPSDKVTALGNRVFRLTDNAGMWIIVVVGHANLP